MKDYDFNNHLDVFCCCMGSFKLSMFFVGRTAVNQDGAGRPQHYYVRNEILLQAIFVTRKHMLNT